MDVTRRSVGSSTFSAAVMGNHGPWIVTTSSRRTQSTSSAATATATATYDQSVDAFPSILIGPDRSIEPQGSFAEAQAQVRGTG